MAEARGGTDEDPSDTEPETARLVPLSAVVTSMLAEGADVLGDAVTEGGLDVVSIVEVCEDVVPILVLCEG